MTPSKLRGVDLAARLPDLAVARRRSRGVPYERYCIALAGAVLVVLVLFSFVQRLIRSPRHQQPSQPTTVRNVQVQNAPSPKQQQLKLPSMPKLSASKSPPAPPSISAPSLAAPQPAAVSAPALDVAPVGIPTDIGGGSDLMGTSAFGGFAGVGSGAGGSGNGGGGGFGHGQGFKGRTLIPLATARPEITKWAYEHKIQGWVEVVFTVNKLGQVRNIRIVDAHPKGVFEAAAVRSISHWIYPKQSHPIEVEQRVQFRLKDYKYNWNTN